MRRKYVDKNRILLVNITRLGDMLQATPAIAGMKMENPSCHITVLVEQQFSQVCHWLPDIDEVLTLDLGMTVRSLARGHDGVIDAFEYVSGFIDELKTKNFDYCLNMSSSAYTALLLKMLDVQRHGGWMADEEGYRVIESDWAKLFATSVFHQNRQFNSINLVDVFRCSADVEMHPQQLKILIGDEQRKYCNELIAEAGFTNTGPLIAIQAGASQGKRQWSIERFVELIKVLLDRQQARIVLTGTTKELSIIEPIKAGCNSENVFIAAGKTDIPQLAALLELSEILITGDTGPMHMAVAAGTPVIAMFLASAYGFETGPYSTGNIVLQPVIICGPCNPNKPCTHTECHDHIDSTKLAELAMLRIKGDIRELPQDFVDPRKLIVYRTYFDQYGFYDMEALSSDRFDQWAKYRQAYRKLWLSELAGYKLEEETQPSSSLKLHPGDFSGLDQVAQLADQGSKLIDELVRLIGDSYAPPKQLATVNQTLTELDRAIEQTGFHFSPLGPVTRMMIFAKENLVGTEAVGLASQMKEHYRALGRRCEKLGYYYANLR